MRFLLNPVFYRSTNICRFIRRNLRNCPYCFELQHNAISYSSHKNFSQISDKCITIHPSISVNEIAGKLHVKSSSILDLLKEYGYDTDNGTKTILHVDIAELIADEFGFSVVQKSKEDAKHLMLPRAPVVTIMGHVDHGKTTLLDYLRNTEYALNEAGGITQSIGAFSVQVPGLKGSVTFVDTPGHAAFNSMRARGAQLTDIVVLVIAADDGIMQQTKECLAHISESNVPFIIAINKVDKSNANPDKVRRELLVNGVQLEGYGGDTKSVEISALKGTNIDALLVLLNDFAIESEFQASHEEAVSAIILEAESDKRKGIVASALVKSGTLRKGKVLLAGTAMAKVRQLFNVNGEVTQAAFPSDPVQIVGWRTLPSPGDEAIEMESEAEARNVLKLLALASKPEKVVQKPLERAPGKKPLAQEFRRGRNKRMPYRVELRLQAAAGVKVNNDRNKEFNVVIKADVSGSLEAILAILSTFHSEHMKLNVLKASVGDVTLTDLQLADACNGVVYSFNTDTPEDILNKAEETSVSVRSFDVIYKLLDDMKEEIVNILPLRTLETIMGEGEVLMVFQLGGKGGAAAGCRVTEGQFYDQSNKNHVWRVMRDNKTIHEGTITSLKHGAREISVAKQLSECGVVLGKFDELQKGDRLLCIEQQHVKEIFEWKL